jgi:hypothetical protein
MGSLQEEAKDPDIEREKAAENQLGYAYGRKSPYKEALDTYGYANKTYYYEPLYTTTGAVTVCSAPAQGFVYTVDDVLADGSCTMSTAQTNG